MTELDKVIQIWQKQGHSVEVKNAPKGAVTFDRMLIVYSKPNETMWVSSIRAVHFYDNRLGKFVADF